MNSYRPRGEQIFPLSALQIGILQKWHFTISEKVAIIKKLFRAVAQLREQAIRRAGPPLLVSCIMQDLKLYISTIWGRSSAGRAYGSHPYGRTSTCEFQPMISREFPPESSKIEKLENLLFVAKTCKKRRYGPIAQLGERSVRIREVEGSNPFGSTISRKITAILAVIFRLTTIIPQTAENPDHFWNPQAVSSSPSPPADFRFMCLPVLPVLL